MDGRKEGGMGEGIDRWREGWMEGRKEGWMEGMDRLKQSYHLLRRRKGMKDGWMEGSDHILRRMEG